MTTGFSRYRKFWKLDVEQLTNSVRSWSGINYSVSSCKSVRKLPYKCPPIFFDTSNYYAYFRFILQYNPDVTLFYSYWIKIQELSTFWTLLLLIPPTNATRTQNMCTGFY